MLNRVGESLGREVTADDVEPWTWHIAELGRKPSGVDFANTKAVINQATRSMAEFLTEYDVYLTPTQGTPPPEIGYLDTPNLTELEHRIDHVHQFTFPFNVTGLPAMSVPLYWNNDGLPVGVQFVGRFADESTLFRLASQLEATCPWRSKFPPVPYKQIK